MPPVGELMVLKLLVVELLVMIAVWLGCVCLCLLRCVGRNKNADWTQ